MRKIFIYVEYIMSSKGGKGRNNSALKSWVMFVKKVQKEEHISYPEAMKRAKARKSEWKRGGAMTDEDTSSSSSGSTSSSTSSPLMMGGSDDMTTSTGSDMATMEGPMMASRSRSRSKSRGRSKSRSKAMMGGKRRRTKKNRKSRKSRRR